MKDQADELRKMMGKKDKRPQRIISIASGKGGVGKTNIAINLAIALNELKQNVLVIDGDLGLGNVNVILGSTPEYNLYHVIKGLKKLPEIVLQTEYGIRYIAGASGFSSLANLSGRALTRLVNGIDALSDADIIIVDTGAGISSTVLSFILSSDETIIVTTPEPTSIIDAYGIIKSIAAENIRTDVKILVNRATKATDAKKIGERIIGISRQFLGMDIKYSGFVFEDKTVPYSVAHQLPFYVYDNKCNASICLDHIAKKIVDMEYDEYKETKGLGGFFESLFAFITKNKY